MAVFNNWLTKVLNCNNSLLFPTIQISLTRLSLLLSSAAEKHFKQEWRGNFALESYSTVLGSPNGQPAVQVRFQAVKLDAHACIPVYYLGIIVMFLFCFYCPFSRPQEKEYEKGQGRDFSEGKRSPSQVHNLELVEGSTRKNPKMWDTLCAWYVPPLKCGL